MILVTGGTGFIGQDLVRRLLSEGRSVRLLARNPAPARKLFPRASVLKGDLLDPDSLKKACSSVDAVIHLAGLVSYSLPREELFRANFQGTRNLLQASRKASRFLFASTVAVYGDCSDKATEGTPPDPLTSYAESKLAAENAVLSSSLPHAALRLSTLYGPDNPAWEEFMAFILRGVPLPKSRNIIDLLHVSDASRAFLLALKKGRGTFNIAGGSSLPLRELASLLAYHLDKKPRFWPVWTVRLLARLRGRLGSVDALLTNRNYDISRAKKALGWEPQTYFEKELRAMVESFKGKNRAA